MIRLVMLKRVDFNDGVVEPQESDGFKMTHPFKGFSEPYP